MTMIKCGGCGRDIDPDDIDAGSRYLCLRCYHLQAAGMDPPRSRSSTVFITTAAVALAITALTGLSLCILYLYGTGNLFWFILLCLIMLLVVACPSVVLLKHRNLSLLVAALYTPLGLWSFLWYLAPGVNWQYAESTTWSALFFFLIGFAALCLFLRDLRMLPRL